MRPEFEKYRGIKPEKVTSVRLSEDRLKLLSILAQAENDTVSGLVIEGVERVILDRASDPTYSEKMKQNVDAAIASLREIYGT